MTRFPVHPHACGERHTLSGMTETLNGSSPRLWGTVARSRLPSISGRFIPTPVGNG